MQTASYVILAAALLPAVILMIIILIRDKEQPEPPRLLIKGVIFGVLSAFGSLAISMPLLSSGLIPPGYSNSFEALLHSFGAAALPEELAKLFFLWLLLRRNPYFDEHLDGIVYSVCIGLGFAAFENIQYVFNAGDNWAFTAILRGLLSVPAHFFFAVLMGYYYSLVHFGHHPRRNAVWVLAAPVLAHGIFDTIAMAQEVSPGLEAIFGLVLLLFCNELRKLCTRHIREMANADKDNYVRS
ncbi:MAG: PrsW family intramembrane metalloprotease [Bacteroidaceae bacterium]|nr:PrsW family intramembrane metalloprotease [Bacteroidaceae bacterium]MBR0432687.1 PrsW family intramembrane metalloprotease [Bacteroidaceae bacterium]